MLFSKFGPLSRTSARVARTTKQSGARSQARAAVFAFTYFYVDRSNYIYMVARNNDPASNNLKAQFLKITDSSIAFRLANEDESIIATIIEDTSNLYANILTDIKNNSACARLISVDSLGTIPDDPIHIFNIDRYNWNDFRGGGR
jgi:hypothetical protein